MPANVMPLELRPTGFDDEEKCALALFKAKWPSGFHCPRCNHKQAYLISTRRLPLYQCLGCRAQTSLIADTVMAGSRTPLRLWFHAIHLHSTPQGVNALQLSRIIGVTYKTAWLICHKIRHAMARANSDELLSALVRIMDSKLCTRATASREWHKQEQSLLIGSSENEAGDIYRIKIKKENKDLLRHRFTSPSAEPFIRQNVDSKNTTRMIMHQCYFGNRSLTLFKIGRQVESWLAHTFLGIGPKHLQTYLDQFCYIWNRQNELMFHSLIGDCATASAITYPALIGVSSVHSKHVGTGNH